MTKAMFVSCVSSAVLSLRNSITSIEMKEWLSEQLEGIAGGKKVGESWNGLLESGMIASRHERETRNFIGCRSSPLSFSPTGCLPSCIPSSSHFPSLPFLHCLLRSASDNKELSEDHSSPSWFSFASFSHWLFLSSFGLAGHLLSIAVNTVASLEPAA